MLSFDAIAAIDHITAAEGTTRARVARTLLSEAVERELAQYNDNAPANTTRDGDARGVYLPVAATQHDTTPHE